MRGAMGGQTSTFIIWRFRAKPDRVEQFRRVYGSAGDWAKLFMRSPEYQGTQLLQDTTEERTFVVIDRWAKDDSFARFHQEFSNEYEELDRQCLELTEEESRIGTFAEGSA
jgi:heme-degrading monooxygenase HmoA